MSKYTFSSDGSTVESYNQPKPTSILEGGIIVGVVDENLPDYGWYPESKGTPTDPDRVSGYEEVPTIVGRESIYTPIERDDTEQEAYLRQTKDATLSGYLTIPLVADPDESARNQDLAQWATDRRADIIAADTLTEVEAVETVPPGPGEAIPLGNDYLGRRQAETYNKMLVEDDQAVASGQDGMAAADKTAVQAALAAAATAREGWGEPPVPPPIARPHVRLQGEKTGHITMEWYGPDNTEMDGHNGWPGYGQKFYLYRDDNTALSVKIYRANGDYWYTPGAFQSTDKGGVWEIITGAGQRLPEKENIGIEVIAGSAPITGIIWLKPDSTMVRGVIRWAGEHVGTSPAVLATKN